MKRAALAAAAATIAAASMLAVSPAAAAPPATLELLSADPAPFGSTAQIGYTVAPQNQGAAWVHTQCAVGGAVVFGAFDRANGGAGVVDVELAATPSWSGEPAQCEAQMVLVKVGKPRNKPLGQPISFSTS